MRFVLLGENPVLADELIQNMENNSDWKEILPWLNEMVSESGSATLPIITAAYDNEEMVGFFVIADHELLKENLPYSPWLGILMVFDRFRGRGYSPVMIKEACRVTKRAGFDTLYLATEHIHYYERLGFEEIGLSIYQWGAPTKIYHRDLTKG